MEKKQIEDIYFTLIGVIREEFRVLGVEDLFSEGSDCMNCYSEMLAAYERLRQRLSVANEDGDMETIIRCLTEIERIVSLKMFEYGMKFALMTGQK